MLSDVVIRAMLAAALALVPAIARAQHASVTFDLPDDGDVTITSEVIVSEAGSRSYRHERAPGSRAVKVRGYDKGKQETLLYRVDGAAVVIEWPEPLAGKLERRLVIEETADRSPYLSVRPDGAIDVHNIVPLGRTVVLLPSGYNLEESSVPVQITTEAGRTRLGFVKAVDHGVAIRMSARRQGEAPAATRIEGVFRAEDERSIVYWLEDPATQQVSLALDLVVDHPGQGHVYSVLREDDHIADPTTVDVDRGRELPTRRITGREANRIGDSPVRFPDDASVLVADLGYTIQDGGSARIRMHQTATDRKGYRLLPSGQLQWDRFLARVRTRAVLPSGWALASLDQPAVVSRDAQGRVTLDFVHTGGDSPSLRLTARRVSGPGAR